MMIEDRDNVKDLERIRKSEYGLKYKDFLKLLESDPDVQKLISTALVTNSVELAIKDDLHSKKSTFEEESAESLLIKLKESEGIIIGQKNEIDNLNKSLSDSEIKLSKILNLQKKYENAVVLDQQSIANKLYGLIIEDEGLCKSWMLDRKKKQSLSNEVTRIIVKASQWGEITFIWEDFLNRCKSSGGPITKSEYKILELSVELHNLSYSERSASLILLESNDVKFDRDIHQRSTPQGDFVSDMLLPGLRNAAGSVDKKILVVTK